jgi:hypothetical protein
MQAALAQGNINVAAVGASIIQIITGQTTTNTQLAQLAAASQQLNIPKNWQQAGLTHRLWSQAQFRADEGQLLLFLLANLPQGFDTDKNFLIEVDDNLRTMRAISIRNVAAKMKDRFLDIDNRALISITLAKNLASNGIDNGRLDLSMQPTP